MNVNVIALNLPKITVRKGKVDARRLALKGDKQHLILRMIYEVTGTQ